MELRFPLKVSLVNPHGWADYLALKQPTKQKSSLEIRRIIRNVGRDEIQYIHHIITKLNTFYSGFVFLGTSD